MTVDCVSSVIRRLLYRSAKPIVTERAAADRAKSSPKITVAPLMQNYMPVVRTGETILLFAISLFCVIGAVALFARQATGN